MKKTIEMLFNILGSYFFLVNLNIQYLKIMLDID